MLLKIENAANQFLSIDLYKLGYIFEDKNVVKSVKRQIPFTIEYPNSIVSKKVGILHEAYKLCRCIYRKTAKASIILENARFFR